MVHQNFKYLASDQRFFDKHIRPRLPGRIIDAHVHIALPKHTASMDKALIQNDWAMQCATNMSAAQLGRYSPQLFPDTDYEYVALPMPMKGVDLAGNNEYLASLPTRRLMAVHPSWDIETCERALPFYAGFKPYPALVSAQKGAEVSVFDFMPHAQLKLLNEHKKAVLLHLPRAGRLPDDDNIRELREMRQRYPDIKIVVAHFGRCFNLQPFLDGTDKLGEDLPGFYFDTAAVINPDVYAASLERISPKKIIFGTDMPILLWHGKRTWENGTYQNLCKEDFPWNKHTEGAQAESKYTFFIYEQLKSILDAIGDDEAAKQNIFLRNAQAVFGTPPEAPTAKRVTLKDVAAKSGYSLRTVKKAMGGKEYVSEKAKEKVIAASEAIGYRRNKFASALAQNRSVRVAVVYTETSKYFFPEVRKGFEACAGEYRDFGVSVEYFTNKGEGDVAAAQLERLNALRARDDIDGVVLHPVGTRGAADAIDALAAAGKPVITFGSDVPGSARLCCVGPDGEKSGRVAAQIMGNYIGRRGSVCVLGMVPQHRQTRHREDGFIAKMREGFADVTLDVHEFRDVPDENEYRAAVEKLIADESVSGIFSTSANVYIAGQAAKAAGRQDIVIIGYDLPDETKALLKEEYISVSMFQNPALQAQKSMKMMCEYLLEGKQPESRTVYTDVSVITGECL